MLLYSILHLSGYDVSIDELKNFRRWESITPGHPEFGLTAGVETTTGPLGQGFANALGMAIAQEYLSAMFNKDDMKILDHHIYGICSDGDLMEGVSHEAASLAGHLKLGKVIFFYDDNNIFWKGKTYKRSELNEGSNKLPWEKAAYKTEKNHGKKNIKRSKKRRD